MFPTRQVLHHDSHLRTHIPVNKFLVNRHGWDRPAEKPFRSLRRQVDTAMTARMSIIIVPISAMKGDAAFGDIQHPRHTGQVKSAGGDITSRHMARGAFMESQKVTIRCSIGTAA